MVSIVIPYIDELDFLSEAVKSAKEQDTHSEIIVVCNKSGDFHQPPYMPEHILFFHEPNAGSPFARNKGLHQAKGEWIQFLDVDDLILPGKIRHQLEHATGSVIVSPHIYQHLDESTETSKWITDDIWCGLLNSGLGSTSSWLWKKAAVVEMEGWSTAYGSHQEYELLFRLVSAGHRINFFDHAETIVRQRKSGSITTTSQPLRAEEGIRLREAMWEYLKDNKLVTPERKKAFLQYIFRQLRGLYRIDREKAKETFKRYFTDEMFTPENVGIPLYHLLYKLMGFRGTENMLAAYSKIRDSYLPFLPKNS